MNEAGIELAGVITGLVAKGASVLADLLTANWADEAAAVAALDKAAEEFFQAVGDGRDYWKARQARRQALLNDIAAGIKAKAEADAKAKQDALKAEMAEAEKEQGC